MSLSFYLTSGAIGRVHTPHDVEIRQADILELEGVFRLWQQTGGLVLRPEESSERLQSLLATDRLRLYVARRRPQLIGAVLAGQDGRRGYLYHLAVVETARQQGVGRGLVNAALRDLAAQGIVRSQVCITIENKMAQGFWVRMGWQDRTDLKVFSYCDQDAICHAD